MNLLVIGSTDQARECREKFGKGHSIVTSPGPGESLQHIPSAGVLFDFVTPAEPARVSDYPQPWDKYIFFDTSVTRLADIVKTAPWLNKHAFGFCGLQTLVNRELLEVTILNDADKESAKQVCERLGTGFRIVADQAGMVTPRVLCMIINEAYFTLEEGTASRKDIDLAMKLGTNYPYGPFEWGDRIGLTNVVRVLQAAGRDSGDTRYAVCPLLLRKAGA